MEFRSRRVYCPLTSWEMFAIIWACWRTMANWRYNRASRG